MPSFQLHPGFAAQSIRCNPWKPSQFLITASEHFGVVGSGKVYVVETVPGFADGSPVPLLGCFGTANSAFDACFSEIDQNLIAVACGDGVKLYRVPESFNQNGVRPVLDLVEHQKEVSCVVWNSAKRDTFFSASWDRTIKVYSSARPLQSMATLMEHMKEVYEVAVTPRNPTTILSCSGDGTWKMWDLRTSARAIQTQVGHDHHIILSIDFNKHDPNVFATGGVDRNVRIWDARRTQQPLVSFAGHDQACRRVRWSPHSRTMLASAGYDMRVNVWDLSKPQQPLIGRYVQHREFVTGLEWNPTTPHTLASCSFDGSAFFMGVGRAPSRSAPTTPLPQALPPPRDPRPRPRATAGLPSMNAPPLMA